MSLTVKKLKEVLEACPSDMVIQTEQNDEIVHIINMGNTLILSKTKPIGRCNRSGHYVYPTDNYDEDKCYKAFSPALDEDLFSFEFEAFTEEELKRKAEECL